MATLSPFCLTLDKVDKGNEFLISIEGAQSLVWLEHIICVIGFSGKEFHWVAVIVWPNISQNLMLLSEVVC